MVRWESFLPTCALAAVLLGTGCGDREPQGAHSTARELPYEQVVGTGDHDERWGLPATLLKVEGLELLAARLSDQRQAVRASKRVPAADTSVGSAVDWDLLRMVPSRNAVLVALHAVSADGAGDWILTPGWMPGTLVGGLFSEREPTLLDLVSRPSIPREFERLWDAQIGESGHSLEDLRTKWNARLRGDALVVLARMADVFDRVEHTDPWSDAPDPIPAITTVLPLADGVSAAEFERELAAHAPTFGFSKAKRIAHRGVTYVRMGVEWKTRDLQHLRPAWAVVERCLVLSSYEPALIAALDALRAPAEHAPVSKRPEVVAARSSAPAGLRRVLFADLALLCAVPPDQEPGRGPRGWHWDRRRLWVQDRYDVREMAMAERSKLLVKHREENERELTREDEETIERAIDAFVEAEQARFPERLEAYRLRLAKLSALRSLTLVQSNVDGGVRTDVTVRRED